jgi:hypothetical protein
LWFGASQDVELRVDQLTQFFERRDGFLQRVFGTLGQDFLALLLQLPRLFQC